MRSSATAYNPLRTPLWLGSIAVAALALALLIAFISIIPHPKPRTASTSPQATMATPVALPTSAPSVIPPAYPASLWNVLVPWGIGLDAVAIAGLVAVFVLRSKGQRRRGMRA